MAKIDEATKSILGIIPDDAKINIARAQESHFEFSSELTTALESTSNEGSPIVDFANEFVFQIIYTLLSHYINIEEEEEEQC